MVGLVLSVLAAAGCSTYREVSGSSLVLDMNPRAPHFEGSYDFDLLASVAGKSCVSRSNTSSTYWVGMVNLKAMAKDDLTREAIAAAAYDAISRLSDADSIVVTRVVTEGKGIQRVCATVYGRGVRLKKGRRITPSATDDRETPVEPPDTSDE